MLYFLIPRSAAVVAANYYYYYCYYYYYYSPGRALGVNLHEANLVPPRTEGLRGVLLARLRRRRAAYVPRRVLLDCRDDDAVGMRGAAERRGDGLTALEVAVGRHHEKNCRFPIHRRTRGVQV